MYCRYFHAYIVTSETWFFVATLRSLEHAAFDRTLDRKSGLFEMFVPEGYVDLIRQFLAHHHAHGVVRSYAERPNRLKHEEL